MNDLEKKVLEIIRKVAESGHQKTEIRLDDHLLAPPLSLEPYELVYIVLELMEQFQITFSKDDFDEYGFGTPRGIIHAVERHLQKQ